MAPYPATSSPNPRPDNPLAELYVAHAPTLTRWMTAYTRDAELAEDVVQEAFLRLAHELRAGRQPDHAPAWLAQVARNLATSRARRNATATRLAPRLEHPRAPDDPAAVAVASERAGAVRAALAELRPADRTALVMAAEGHHNAEIALRLGRTELATRTLLCRARRRLRVRLAPLAMA